MNDPKVKALAGWYGSNRILAAAVGASLVGCSAVFIPFAGGMSELLHIKARTLVVNDLHMAMVNYARVAADPKLGPRLYRSLRREPFHPVSLIAAQSRCVEREGTRLDPYTNDTLFDERRQAAFGRPDFEWAHDYFIACWMGRGGNAGTASEFRGKLSLRGDAGGGDSNTRYRSAVASLVAWRRILARCNFDCKDAFDFLEGVRDVEGNGIYCDPPWPDAGDSYKFSFTETHQRRLADVLSKYRHARVVIRFGAHPLIEELYSRERWNWREQTSRAQSNGDVKEALIMNSVAKAQAA